jgi:hypothetical protein
MNSSPLPQQYSYSDKDWQDEHPERYGWWINELNSLGVEPDRMKEIDDLRELRNITQSLKETLFQYYKSRMIATATKIKQPKTCAFLSLSRYDKIVQTIITGVSMIMPVESIVLVKT